MSYPISDRQKLMTTGAVEATICVATECEHPGFRFLTPRSWVCSRPRRRVQTTRARLGRLWSLLLLASSFGNSLQPAKAHPHPRLPATLAAVGLRGHKAVGPDSLYHSPDQCRALTYLSPIPNWQAGQFPRNRNRCAGVPAPARSDGGRTAGSGTSRPSRGQNFDGSLTPRPWEERPLRCGSAPVPGQGLW